MLRIPNVICDKYVAHFDKKKVPPTRYAEYKKWLRYYLDFRDKYPVPANKAEQVRMFCEKQKEKKPSEAQWERAVRAVSLYFEMLNIIATNPAEDDDDLYPLHPGQDSERAEKPG